MGRPGVVVDETKSVYVNNLPYTATEEDVVAFFSQAGRVVDYRRREKEEGSDLPFSYQPAPSSACVLSCATPLRCVCSSKHVLTELLLRFQEWFVQCKAKL